MHIGFRQLEAFVAVADKRSFRAAGERLNTTQPNISVRISTLETALGYALFERASNGVRLTPRGEDLLDYARNVLKARDSFLSVAGAEKLTQGTLRLGVTEMIAHSWLGAYLLRLKDALPNISIDLTVDLSANLTPQLLNRALDLALQSGPFDQKMSSSVGLGSYSLVWVAAPSLGAKQVLTGALLEQFPVLTHARGTEPYVQLADYLIRQNINAQLVPSSNLAACLKMTADGLGIACLPKIMVDQELKDKRLEILRYDWHPKPLKFEARFDGRVSPAFVHKAADIAGQLAQQFGDK